MILMQAAAQRPRKRGIGWVIIFLIAFAATSYLIRDWGGQPTTPQGSDAPATQGQQVETEDFLTEIGNETWRSPAGLVYGPGSREGHRLKHLARHLQDDPDRDIHGVFTGGMDEVLEWLDEAYQLSKKDSDQVVVKPQGNRTTIEAELTEVIGFVGGEAGRESENPETRRLRLVVEGDRVITAFPIWPPRR